MSRHRILPVQHACDIFQDIPSGQFPLSVLRLAQERNRALRKVFEHYGVAMDTTYSSDIRSVLKGDFLGFKKRIPSIWKYRLTTSTYQYHLGDTMYYDEMKSLSSKDALDYRDISDGGMKVCDTAFFAPSSDARQLSLQIYLKSIGGGMSSRDLREHPIFQAIIPDDVVRKTYILCLRILDMYSISSPGMHSLWRPGQMESGYLRFVALGLKGEAVYPPNVTTRKHHIIFMNNR